MNTGRICIDCNTEMILTAIEPGGDENNTVDFLTVECACMVKRVEMEYQDFRILKRKEVIE